MKLYAGLVMGGVAALLLLGCGGKGSSAPAPNNVTVEAKDSRIVVTWDMESGVEYWLWKAAGDGVTPQNCSAMLYCSTLPGATSPTSVYGLANGTVYSFSINSRIDNGPGGSGSASISATPRLAGATWTVGTAQGADALRGVAYGNSKFVAVGDANTLLSSTDGSTWSALTSPAVAGTNLNAVVYNAGLVRHYVAGQGGVILQSTDSAVTWTPLSSDTMNNLNAIASNGSTYIVAVGDNGTITMTSDGGANWATQTSGTSQPLRGVIYGYDSTNVKFRFVAVGDAGTLLYSEDAVIWTAGAMADSSSLTDHIKSVSNGFDNNGVYRFIAVGTNGTVLTSPDGISWSRVASATIGATQLNAITYSASRRFVAVGNGGQIYYSEYSDPTAWTLTTFVTATPIHALTTGGLFDYAAVGASGLNLYAD